MTDSDVFIHDTADVDPGATLGDGTRVWNWVQVRENATIGRHCVLAKGVYVDAGVRIGDFVKIQNNVSLFAGVTVGDGAFIGPHVVFTNDLRPRAVSPDMTPLDARGWTVSETRVGRGASIGAGSVIVAGVTLGEWCLVAAGCTVTRDVPAYALVMGSPARQVGWVDARGNRTPGPS